MFAYSSIAVGFLMYSFIMFLFFFHCFVFSYPALKSYIEECSTSQCVLPGTSGDWTFISYRNLFTKILEEWLCGKVKFILCVDSYLK